MMKFIYHGTTGDVALRALREGLRPRVQTGAASHWDHTVSSSTDLVYLTACYAPYFAMTAQPKDLPAPDQRWAVLEIDLEALDEDRLMPDEDFLEQGSRGVEMPSWCNELGLRRCKGMKARTVWFRQHIELFHELWEASIDHLGTVAHQGAIPPSAIRRVGIFTPNQEAGAIVASVLDPMIMIENFKYMNGRYRAVTRWFVGDAITPAEYYGDLFWEAMRDKIDDKALEGLKRVLETHPGLEVIEP